MLSFALMQLMRKKKEKSVSQTIINSGKELIAITLEQMNHFAGNMLQVHNEQGKKLLVMSAAIFFTRERPA